MVSSFSRTIWVVGFSLLAYSTLSYSHEYWLDPINSKVDSGSKVIVDVRNGQDYSGASFPYDAAKYKSIEITNNNSSIVYKGRLGDYPAIHHIPEIQGLHSVSLETTENYIVYDSWNKFSEFLSYHGLGEIEGRHLSRQLPQTDIKERYFRSAKTFFQVDGEPASDQENHDDKERAVLAPVGSQFEMSLLDNPYAAIDNLSVQLHFAGAPLPSRQIEMFWKGPQLLRLTTQTDENGIATFKLLGDGDYMLNAVQVVEPEKQGVHWVSYWASITFER